MRDLVSIILAGGKGTRMKSRLPKVLFKLGDKTLVEHCVETVKKVDPAKIIVVVGYRRNLVKNVLRDKVDYAVQEKQLGTGHAAQQAEKILADFHGYVIISNGDMPLLTKGMFLNLYQTCRQKQAAAALLTVESDNFSDWGRVVRLKNGSVQGIIEAKDAVPTIAKIREKNVGLYCFRARDLFTALRKVNAQNVQKEYYLTDVIGIMGNSGLIVEAVKTKDYRHIIGVNSREDLAKARKILTKG